MTEEQVKIGLEICQAASEGPWSIPHIADPLCKCDCCYVFNDKYMGSICTVEVNNDMAIGEGGNDGPPKEETKANGIFISYARTSLPIALAYIIELEERIKELQSCKYGTIPSC